MGFTTTTESPRRQDRSRFRPPAHARPVVPGHAHNSGFPHRQSPTCSLRVTLDPAGVKRRDNSPAVGDHLPEESAPMEFSRTTGVVPRGMGPPGRDRQHRILTLEGIFSCRGSAGTSQAAKTRKTRGSHEIRIPRSGGGGQEVNNRKADEVFAEHGSKEIAVTGGGCFSSSSLTRPRA